ncbi:MAG: ion transporter [Gammaproteobacteria bacterium]|nr:ion transporter [Gammaproteobacteria bacterium]
MKESVEFSNNPQTSWRVRLGAWVESGWRQRAIISLIVANAITIGLETSPAVVDHIGGPLKAFGALVLVIFVIEIVVKLIAYGPRFFRSGWNNLDFFIVAIALIPTAGWLSILRTLRIMRVLRLLSTVPRLRQLTESLLAAIPSIGWITFMLGLVFYVFSVIGTELFGAQFPDWFGSIGATMYTLFQVMTLESWSMGIARPVMQAFPLAWLYFVPFILISAFTILNLFIGVIVNTMQAFHWEEEEDKRKEQEQRAHTEREEMMSAIHDIAARLARMEDGRNDSVS